MSITIKKPSRQWCSEWHKGWEQAEGAAATGEGRVWEGASKGQQLHIMDYIVGAGSLVYYN